MNYIVPRFVGGGGGELRGLRLESGDSESGGSSHSELQMASENQSSPHRLGSAFTHTCTRAHTRSESSMG